MTDPAPNPYAVTVIDDLSGERSSSDDSFDQDVVGTTGVVIGTVGMTTSAGAMFGLILVLIVGVASLISSFDAEMTVVVPIALMVACVVGGLLAAVTGVIACLILTGLVALGSDRPLRWRPPLLRWVQLGTGFMAGWISGAILSGLDFGSIAVGLIPAAFGGAFNRIVGERKIRRAKQVQEQLNARTDAELPPGRS